MATVMFIDDDLVTLKIVSSILESSNYVVIATPDPRDALDRLEKDSVDLVITDANMPGGISGFDVVKTIRKHARLSKLPVAILTGRREKKDIERGLECGADDYIIKPIDAHILLGKIEMLLKKRSSLGPSLPFSEGPVRQQGHWPVNIEITYVSERGLTFVSPFPVAIDSKLKLMSPFYDLIGIEPPILRAIGFTRDGDGTNRYLVNAAFIGLTDNDLQKIRMWINTNCRKKTA